VGQSQRFIPFRINGIAGSKLMPVFQGRHFLIVSSSDGLRVARCLVLELYLLKASLDR